MRILVLTFYFRPDLSAGSFRATALVDALVEAAEGGADVDVLTTLPNRYHSFSVEAAEDERVGPVRVHRLRLPLHQNGMIGQSRAFIVFARQVLRKIQGEAYDLVIATSSRLFTAYLGAICARRLRAPLYLDIRDIFTDTISDVLGKLKSRVLMPALQRIERHTITSAARVNVVSAGFLPYFRARYPNADYRVFTNGIDSEFVDRDFMNESTGNMRRTVLYAGNIGEGQGLHHIVPGLAERLGDRYEFVIVGDGGARERLERSLAAAGVDNVRVAPPVPRFELFEYYRHADCLFLHLNRYQAFEKVLPSKIFEYAATGKPILAGVAGYAAEFLHKEVLNSVTFVPGDVDGAVRAFQQLEMKLTDRNSFVQRFQRTNIMSDMARDVLALGKN